MSVKRYDNEPFEFTIPVLIIGGGACGLSAALAASDAGAAVLVLERDPVPLGTTAMSSGLIPAAGTKVQREAGITDDDPQRFADDLVNKTGGALEPGRALTICAASTQTVDWLIDCHDIPLSLFVTAGSLPGHSRARLHGTPNRTGEELMAALQTAAENAGVDVLTNAIATALLVDGDNSIRGVEVSRPDGSIERIGCDTLILATCGFAGNRELVSRNIPELENIEAHTHPGAQGDALLWGEELGAATGDLAAYQGHANIAAGHGLLVSWLAISEGGFQVNSEGHRFSNEARGYSEQAVDVAAQPDGFAWTIYDQRIDTLMHEIAEYREVRLAGALLTADTIPELARKIRIPADMLSETMTEIETLARSGANDRFGRSFSPDKRLEPPFIAVKVNPALFHTQGGLEVDEHARVFDREGNPLPNLYAGGGAARGVSGPGSSGYVAGNGLMTATTLGRLAGEAAAGQAIAASAGLGRADA
ncbi:FAD-dependent oxidoreductase [Parasphingopyxis algicola]|uniref:FAD-dependent oxidoreductase n=1 Tax=Parasphingopyxis algicola TaxID=2026624 RepID=UPI0015A4E4C4|nr:FAD-dependent oxidoreductase [Parasphingopyxis algicola]QLC26367.1 FAD-dependent oxidoreductase [Parasphingopyxis algicola]